jgi:hypothetical protein
VREKEDEKTQQQREWAGLQSGGLPGFHFHVLLDLHPIVCDELVPIRHFVDRTGMED